VRRASTEDAMQGGDVQSRLAVGVLRVGLRAALHQPAQHAQTERGILCGRVVVANKVMESRGAISCYGRAGHTRTPAPAGHTRSAAMVGLVTRAPPHPQVTRNQLLWSGWSHAHPPDRRPRRGGPSPLRCAAQSFRSCPAPRVGQLPSSPSAHALLLRQRLLLLVAVAVVVQVDRGTASGDLFLEKPLDESLVSCSNRFLQVGGDGGGGHEQGTAGGCGGGVVRVGPTCFLFLTTLRFTHWVMRVCEAAARPRLVTPLPPNLRPCKWSGNEFKEKKQEKDFFYGRKFWIGWL